LSGFTTSPTTACLAHRSDFRLARRHGCHQDAYPTPEKPSPVIGFANNMTKHLALLALLVATPAAAEPPQYRGAWCNTKWQTIYRRCPEGSAKWSFTIRRNLVLTEDSACEITAFRKSSNGERRVWLKCQQADVEGYTSGVERWRIGTNGTRLQILRTEE
jgi:hypothetical protein